MPMPMPMLAYANLARWTNPSGGSPIFFCSDDANRTLQVVFGRIGGRDGRRGMRYLSHDPGEVRRWAEAREAVPAVTDDGMLILAMPDLEYTTSTELTWEEFAGMFTAENLAFVYDEVSGSDFWIIGPEPEVLPFVREAIPQHVP